MNLTSIFLTGLFTGGLTCLAVQGGLLATTLAQSEEERIQKNLSSKNRSFPILAFLTAKLICYTLLGFLLGSLGSLFQISLQVTIILQIAIGIFMLGTALNLLEVHPIFRYFTIQPPKFLTRLIRKESKSRSLLAPIILGAMTVFIPCGTTQAMMALAIGSGNSLAGAAILFSFILGTSPLFFVLGYFASRLGETLHKQFLRFAAVLIIFISIFTLNSAVALSGSNFTLNNLWDSFNCGILAFCDKNVLSVTNNVPVQEATITIDNRGYTPKVLTLKTGSPITLHLENKGGGGCASSFTIPQLGIQKAIPIGGNQTITFNAPSKPAEVAFMCSMNMFRGKMIFS